MPLIDQVQQQMVAAMKSRDEARLSALRMLKAALMKQKVDSPKPLDEAEPEVGARIVAAQVAARRVNPAEPLALAGNDHDSET